MNQNASVEKPALKLFVVGESSGDPDKWSDLGGYSIIIAANKEQAERLSSWPGPVCEIPMTAPCVLATVRLANTF
jgi:ribonuclease H / adenosylcobalamin/alpha-ribazole phosphatase